MTIVVAKFYTSTAFRLLRYHRQHTRVRNAFLLFHSIHKIAAASHIWQLVRLVCNACYLTDFMARFSVKSTRPYSTYTGLLPLHIPMLLSGHFRDMPFLKGAVKFSLLHPYCVIN
jgi:hypothetical protein